MKLVINGKVEAYEIEPKLEEAINKALDLVEKNNPELFNDLLQKCTNVYSMNLEVTFGFDVANVGEGAILTANHNGNEEVLTFVYNVTDHGLEIVRNNDEAAGEESMFSDKLHAIFNATNLVHVEPSADVSDAEMVMTNKIGSLLVEVYNNGVARYYDEGGLVQETTFDPEHLSDVLEQFEYMMK